MATIVVAEDDDDIRAVVARILRKAGHTVVVTHNGATGLDAVLKHRPDLVISDIDMPVMSGIDLCHAIRADTGICEMPVLFISGSSSPGDTRAADAQATAFLAKPFRSAELVASAEKVMHLGHQPGCRPPAYP